MPKQKRVKNTRSSKIRSSWFSNFSNSSLTLILLGIFLILISLSWHVYQSNVLSFSNYQPASQNQTVQALPKKITIPALNIDLNIIDSPIINGNWQINPDGASYLQGSGYPGLVGNTVIYGHNKDNLFGPLISAQVGQTINITTTDGLVHAYKIDNIFQVDPSQVDVLNQTDKEILTIYTCTGFLDSKRLIVRARPS